MNLLTITRAAARCLFAAGAALLPAGTAAAQGECLLFDLQGKEPVYQSGEKVTYTISYTWGIWINVGEVEFLTSLVKSPQKPFYHIIVNGKTYPFFDNFFRVRDYFSTKIDAHTLAPFYMQRTIDEGGYRRTSTGRYNRQKSVIYSSTQRLDKRQPAKRDTLPLTPCTFDVVSIFYYYRCCDFSKMKTNTTYTVQLAMDNEVHSIRYKLYGKEDIYVRGVGKFRTLKFSASLIAGSVFTGKEQVFFWVTDDVNRVPVYVEAPIKVGSIRARIKTWENLKHHLAAKR
ncbi:MAG: DUF3108 domain-containing protein [Prevotellaceae bacterium]|jgi:hypothetical protein|nr:DUF3108 domain-containing protein [Prevotellaceae bacterium]